MCHSKNHKGYLISRLVIYLSRMGFQLYHVLLQTLFGHSSTQPEKNKHQLPSMRSISTRSKTGSLSTVSILLFAMFLTACESDSNDHHDPDYRLSTPINRTLIGTAAVGMPVKGDIFVIGTDGKTLNTQSNINGKYSVNLGGQPGPYLVRVEPDDNSLPALYSYATSSGVTNITPFTTLALFLAYPNDFPNSFNNWATLHSNWNPTNLKQARAKINANFATQLQNSGVDPIVYDFFTVPFEANQTGIDAFLDNYNVSFDYDAKTYNITNSSGQPVAFNEHINTAHYYIGARFLPENTAKWKLTWIPEFDGQQGTAIVSYPGNNVPWSEEQFNAIFWDKLVETPSQVTRCNENSNIECNISVLVTHLDTHYDVIGNGGVGTIVRGNGTYNWNMNGWYQQDGQSRQNIDKSTAWFFSWSWERIS